MTREQRIILVIAVLASAVAFLDSSVVNVALPAINRALGGGLVIQEWVVDAYLITLGSLILLAGSLSDLFGRRRILSIGLIGFASTSLLCAVATTSVWLIVARALQGAAGALLVPSSLALIMSSFSGQAQGKAVGRWTAWTGISFVIGPLLGGFLVDAISWRLIFAINIVPVALCLWMIRRLDVEEQASNVTLDTFGAVSCSLGLSGTVFGLIEQPHYGWGNPCILVSIVGGMTSLLLFVWHESRTSTAMLPLSLFKVRNFSVGNAATLSIYGGLSIATFLIAIFLQQVSGYSAFEAGLALLPVTILSFILSPRFGMLAGKYGPRLFMTVGPIIAAVGFSLMLRVSSHVQYWSQLLPGVLVFALGLSTTVAPLTSAVLSDVEKTRSGVASAVNNAVSRIAGLIAVAFVGLITGTHLDLLGFRRALLATVFLMIFGGIVSWAGIRNHTNKALSHEPATIENL